MGHALRMVHGRVLQRALEFEVDGQRKNGRLKRTWRRQDGQTVWRRFEEGRCTFLIKFDFLC